MQKMLWWGIDHRELTAVHLGPLYKQECKMFQNNNFGFLLSVWLLRKWKYKQDNLFSIVMLYVRSYFINWQFETEHKSLVLWMLSY